MAPSRLSMTVRRMSMRCGCLGLIGASVLIGLACSGGAPSSDRSGDGGNNQGGGGGAGPARPAKECLTETFCAVNAQVAPCESGYDCNTTLVPPRCTRLYCGSVG